MTRPQTLVGHVAAFADERPEVVALRELAPGGRLLTTTWAGYHEALRNVAAGLVALGHRPGEAVALVGANRRDWVISQLGIAAAGGVPAPIYTTSTASQTAYIIRHAGARLAFCDDAAQAAKILGAMDAGECSLERLVTMDPDASSRPEVITLAQLKGLGGPADREEVDRRAAAARPDDLALLIYTSGTTGLPKGAEFTHDGIARIGEAMLQVYEDLDRLERRTYVSYLPLSHAAEQAFTNFVALPTGTQVTFCPTLEAVRDALLLTRPTVFFGVPRVWEKMEGTLRARLAEARGLKGRLAAWALATELAAFRETVATGREVRTLARRVANRLVQSKVRAALGFDQLLAAGSGAAPISRSTLDFFASLGVPIHEGYGMTETHAIATVQPVGRPRFGTVGRALPGVDVRIAPDGEVQLRGPTMVRGYLHDPERTGELYTDDGWLRTGDLGTLDGDGFLSITGRLKDLIITAGGKNVAPSELEDYLQGIPGVGQAVVVGDRRPYLVALLVLDEEAAPALCREAGVPPAPIEALARDPRVRAFVADRVERDCNARVARYQTIKRFAILPRAFSVEGGELTPTLKVKRAAVSERYADVIEELYGA